MAVQAALIFERVPFRLLIAGTFHARERASLLCFLFKKKEKIVEKNLPKKLNGRSLLRVVREENGRREGKRGGVGEGEENTLRELRKMQQGRREKGK